MTPQQIIRTYLGIAGLYTLSVSLSWGINTLFLLDAGLDILETFLANAAFTLAMVACEIPTGVLVAPIIPALNDHELETILETVRVAGAQSVGYSLIRLPLEIKDLFIEWLHAHYPLKAEHVLNRLRDIHQGKLYDSTFGTRQKGSGPYAALIARRFEVASKRLEFPGLTPLDQTRFRPPNLNGQLSLFEGG